MATLQQQMEELYRQQLILNNKFEKLQREIKFQNKKVDELEQKALQHVSEISSIFTHLRDKYGKRYKLHSGFVGGERIDVRILEPGAGQSGYDRYLELNSNDSVE
jgi:hypothetical protein